MTEPRQPLLAGLSRPLVQSGAFLRKETVEVLRQPRLLVVLIVAPFLVLLAFAVGYDEQQLVPRTRFVGPPGGVYQASLERHTDDLRRYIADAGYTSDPVQARRDLAADEVDLVVIFPDDVLTTVLEGRQATIAVLHQKLDPIQQATVQVAAEVAVARINAAVVERAVGLAQLAARPLPAQADLALDALRAIETAQASGDAASAQRAAERLDAAVRGLDDIASSTPLDAALRAVLTADGRDDGDAVSDPTSSVREAVAAVLADPQNADVAAGRTAIDALVADADAVLALDPAVLVQPFRSEARSLLPERVDDVDYFAPAAVALLLAHLALTVAAMGLVSDRSLGLFEMFRVGPISAGRIVLGKFLAHLLLGLVVGAALLAAMVRLLGVTSRGPLGWVAVVLVGLLAASIGLGMVLAHVARSSTQAVQFSMLVLLSGLFFGGFILELDAFRYPVKAVSWLLPVTYGVQLLRNSMLRGVAPAASDLARLAALTAGYLALAWYLFARRLRVQ